MLREGRALVAAALAAGLLSACGGSGPAAKPAAPLTAKRVTAAAVLADAVRQLRAGGTGAFDAVTTSMADGFLQTRQVGGAFDLARNTWAGTIDLQVSAVGNPRVGGYAARLAGHGTSLFVNVGRGAKGVQGVRAGALGTNRWYRAATDGLPLAAGDLSGVRFLGRVRATAVRASGGGGQVVTGRLPAADAVSLLGLSQEIRRLKLGPKAMAGTAVVTVGLDPAGRIVRIRLAGTDVTFTGRAPRALRDLVAAASYAQTFHGLGDPVKIALPRTATDAAGSLAVAARNVL